MPGGMSESKKAQCPKWMVPTAAFKQATYHLNCFESVETADFGNIFRNILNVTILHQSQRFNSLRKHMDPKSTYWNVSENKSRKALQLG